MNIEVKDLGLIDYAAALSLQQEAVENQRETVFVCEHPAVITVGRGKEAHLDVLTKTFPIEEVERGGRATLHMPGQVVMYPIINLKKHGLDQVKFLRLLEQTLLLTLSDFRITAHTIEKETGVWVEQERKIASLGIAVRNEMSFHGLALNVSCDLALFQNLKPCGFSPDVMTSMMKELPEKYRVTWKLTGKSLMERVRRRVPEVFLEILGEASLYYHEK